MPRPPDPILLLLALGTLAPAPVAAQGLEAAVLGHVVLPGMELDGEDVDELSGLRWSAAEGLLYAVSDAGHLVLLRPTLPPDGPFAVEPVEARLLRDAAGAELDNDDFNPEGLEFAAAGPPPELLLVSETGPRAAAFAADGTWLREVPLPPAVADPDGQRSEGDGLESVALHPVHGLLIAPEEPRAADPRELHTVFAEDGRTVPFTTTGLGEVGKTSIKDMAVLPDGTILILERERSADGERLTPYLRRLDPAACPAEGPCPTTVARVDVPGITDADFEGLAPMGGSLLVMVSDDETEDGRRSVFALVELASR